VGEKLSSAPVYFTLAQARFNPILSLESFAPQIQERLRKAEFPDAQKGMFTTINLNVGIVPEQQQSQGLMLQTVRYIFGDMNRTSAFVLEPTALSFQTTQYDVFETFAERFKLGLSAVHEAIGLNYTDRIGLRYLDAIFPRSGETLGDYLWPGLLGLDGKFQNDGLTYAFSENLAKAGNINVRLRVIVQDGGVGFPPDLLPLTLKLEERFERLHGRHAIMDTDGWSELRQRFTVNNILEQLHLIHSEIDKTFRVSVTESALNVWR
jgi:uncharacterized protein (TIGR04255 family)